MGSAHSTRRHSPQTPLIGYRTALDITRYAARAEHDPGIVRQHPQRIAGVSAAKSGWIATSKSRKLFAGMRIERGLHRGLGVRHRRTVERFDVKGMKELPRLQRVRRRNACEPGIYRFGAVGWRCQRQWHGNAHDASFSSRDATSSIAASSMRSALLLMAATAANDNNRATGPVMPSDACNKR